MAIRTVPGRRLGDVVVEALSVIAIEFFLTLCAAVESRGTAGDYREHESR